MLGTRKPSEPIDKARGSLPKEPWGRVSGGTKHWQGEQRNYGRLARSDEYSPSVAIPGRESGHFVQVRWRTKDSRVQAGQPLALQEIAAGPVDGREVKRDGTADEAQAESGGQGCRTGLVKRRGQKARATDK